MKRVLAIILALMPISSFAQIDYDKYVPLTYSPMPYTPKSTGAPLEILPYQEESVIPSLFNLKLLLDRTENSPEIREMLIVDWKKYNELYIKTMANGINEYLGKKKNMKHFQEDWTTVDRYYYERDCEAKKLAKEQRIIDSVSFRNSFVKDSLIARDAFLIDSVQARKTFIEDSLYRVNYRKEGNYDYVEFDGPHGRPTLCYRKGKVIDGKTYNKFGFIEKEYKDGVLRHDYKYSDDFLKDWNKERERNNGTSLMDYVRSHYIHDVAQRIKFYYQDVKKKRIYCADYLDNDGIAYRCIYYDFDYSGKPYLDVEMEYYPDRRTYKKVLKKHLETGETNVSDYYSDGSLKETRYYRSESMGGAIKRREIKRDGYMVIEYYDFDGKLERRETEYEIDY